MKLNEFAESMTCSECGGPAFSDLLLAEKKDACYNKVRSRYKVWPSAYASGALVQCRKKGAANWGNKSEGLAEGYPKHQDLSGISTEKLKAYLDKQSKQQVSGEGNQIKRVRAELQRRQQGVAEAGNKPLEKSRIGTGDTRSPRELKTQMQGASDEFVRSTADKKTGPFHSKVAKMQGKLAKSELRRREQGVAEGSLEEKAKSKAQQKFMGMVYAAKKGETPASPEVAKVAKGMSKKSAKDYAKTKHKGLPNKVEETATAGSTSAGNVSVGAVYPNKTGKTFKNKDGTAKNALDVKGANLMTGGSIKR